MMKYRALDENGDMTAGNGDKDFIYSTDAIAQAIRTRLLLLYGEWWEDQEDGLPFFEKIAGQKNKAIAANLIRRRIATTIGVLSVGNIQINFKGRVLTFQAEVMTSEGKIEIKEELI